MLTDGELDALRATAELALPEVCEILRSTTTADGFGGVAYDVSTVAEDVPCRVGAPTKNELQVVADRLGEVTCLTVTLPFGTDVQGDDRITVNGRTLAVASAPVISWATAVRAVCWEVGR